MEQCRDRAHFLAPTIAEAARIIAPRCPPGFKTDPLAELRHGGFHQTLRQTELMIGKGGYPEAAVFKNAYLTGRITDSDLDKAAEFLASQVPRHALENGRHPELPWKCWSERIDHFYGTSFAVEIDKEICRWFANCVDRSAYNSETGSLFSSWKRLVATDPQTGATFGVATAEALGSGTLDPDAAIRTALEDIGVSSEKTVPELRAQLARTPEWSGLAKWRSNQQGRPGAGPALDLVNLLAVRLSYESLVTNLLVGQPRDRLPHIVGPTWTGPEQNQDFRNLSRMVHGNLGQKLQTYGWAEIRRIWLAAYERNYVSNLIDSFDDAGNEAAGAETAYPALRDINLVRRVSPVQTWYPSALTCTSTRRESAAILIGPTTRVHGTHPGDGASYYSYQPDANGGEGRLEAILLGPLVEAHILNWENYFSPTRSNRGAFANSKDADLVGAPDLIGLGGDFQDLDDCSLSARRGNEPTRLTCLIDGSVESVERVIIRNRALGEIVDGEWIYLLARQGPRCRWKLRLTDGSWRPWS